MSPEADGGDDRQSNPCAEALAAVDAYVDGEMSAADRVELMQHLDACPPCGAEADIVAEIKAAVAATGNGVDQDLIDRLRALAATLVPPGSG